MELGRALVMGVPLAHALALLGLRLPRLMSGQDAPHALPSPPNIAFSCARYAHHVHTLVPSSTRMPPHTLLPISVRATPITHTHHRAYMHLWPPDARPCLAQGMVYALARASLHTGPCQVQEGLTNPPPLDEADVLVGRVSK